MDSLSIFLVIALLGLAGGVALLALGPLGLGIGAALLAAAVGLAGYRLFRMVTRRTAARHGVHRRS